jgi:hypothetical protein
MKQQQRSSLVAVMLQLVLVALAVQAWLGLLTLVLLQSQQVQQQRRWSRGTRVVHNIGSYGSSSWQSRGRMVHGCVKLAPS